MVIWWETCLIFSIYYSWLVCESARKGQKAQGQRRTCENLLPPPSFGSQHPAQVVSLGGGHLYPLSHPISPRDLFLLNRFFFLSYNTSWPPSTPPSPSSPLPLHFLFRNKQASKVLQPNWTKQDRVRQGESSQTYWGLKGNPTGRRDSREQTKGSETNLLSLEESHQTPS